jgi:hypothetical protein
MIYGIVSSIHEFMGFVWSAKSQSGICNELERGIFEYLDKG